MQTAIMLSTGLTDHLPIQNLRSTEVRSQMQQKLLRLIRNMSRSKFAISTEVSITSKLNLSSLLLDLYYILQGYYRRGAAFLAMGKFKDALKDFKQVHTRLSLMVCPYKTSIFHGIL
jgi:hypothetical protein